MEYGNVAQWFAGAVTFGAVVVALFKDSVARRYRRPKLEISIRPEPPDCAKNFLSYEVQRTAYTYVTATVFYLRLWVVNHGRGRAEKVQVYAANLSRKAADGSFRRVESFLPMNLRWSHGPPPPLGPEIFADGISAGMGRHCDLAHVVDPKSTAEVGESRPDVEVGIPTLALDLEVAPNSRNHVVAPGTYRLDLRIAASNCAPIARTVEIAVTGKWFDEEARMFADGLSVKIVD